jgi:hypothetical protein
LDRLKKIISVFVLFLSSINWAQTNLPTFETSESVYMHLNATSFVSGETLFYKIQCLNPQDFKKSQISKVAYVELVGENAQIIFKHKVFLSDGTSQGDFFIPPSIKTGTYKLLGYTRWMQNKSSSRAFQSEITIINPFQSSIENKISSKNNSIADSISHTNSEIAISLKNKKLKTRALINLELKINNESFKKGKYSLSVRKVQDLPSITKINPVEFKNSEKDQKIIVNGSNYILPELRGEIISGRIVSKNELFPVNNRSIAFSNPGKSFSTKLVKTNTDGTFYFSIDQPYYNPNSTIQIVDKSKGEYQLLLDTPFGIEKSDLIFENEKLLNSDLKTILEEHAIASQIENTYYLKKADTLSKTIHPTPFYEPAIHEYILDNYNRFPTIKETIIEIVKEMNYDNNDGVYSFRLNDYDTNTNVEEPPLVLVDGLLIQDINELLEYKASEIYKISTLNTGYLYGNKLYSGLISFITKNQNFESKFSGDFIIKSEIDLPLQHKNYYNPVYSESSDLDRIPDYRYQLIWIPDLNTDTKNILLYSSDKTGRFEIKLEGFSDEGNPVYFNDFFEVE